MNTSQVSMEVWERIIDLVGTESNTDPITYYPAIRTCCLVCSSWLPRSRFNLFSKVSITEELSRSGLSRVYCLARTVCERSDLIYLIHELHIRPRTPGRAIPLVVTPGPGTWATAMVSLRTVKLVGVGWHPTLYTATISRFPTPVHLELERVAFDGASSLFHLIWSLPHLVCVILHQVTIPKMSQMKFMKICSMRPQAVLGCLTELSISGNLADEEHFPPPGTFGKVLRKVYLEFSSRHWHKIHRQWGIP
ncbi:hypothetical protein OH76DRAFT_1191315 [Lentinus brumalis]|uniref:F-box domain-containing protein n=1 Tax=Lentinus brumalis TaxID=2498619 RepID=A0A371CTL7_9APHY|nr:hypothetical protein OH76DRAFT_1191315 [Polyporus brumalis]